MSFLDPGLKTLHMTSTLSPSREPKDGHVYVPVSAGQKPGTMKVEKFCALYQPLASRAASLLGPEQRM